MKMSKKGKGKTEDLKALKDLGRLKMTDNHEIKVVAKFLERVELGVMDEPLQLENKVTKEEEKYIE